MKKCYLLIVLILLSITSVFSQKQKQKIDGGLIDIIENKADIKPEHNAPKVRNDTLYCIHTKKQNGWFAPLDTISKEDISKCYYCFRFTNKNEAGNWCRIECIDSYGNYVKGKIGPYILKQNHYYNGQANQEWIDKLKTTCIYEFLADYSGKVTVQGRAYDEDMNLIYIYSRVKIGNKQYIGSYKDGNGFPAEMRNNKGYTAVKITEDEYGNDSIIQYIDAGMKPKLNSDGVDMELFIYDKHGRLIKKSFRNADGTLTKNNWGICGIEYKWDSITNLNSATYMDEKWQPVELPDNGLRTGREGVTRIEYKYENSFNKLISSEQFYNSEINDKAYVKKSRLYRINYDYYNGKISNITGKDKDLQLAPFDLSSRHAKEEFKYDNKGKIKDYKYEYHNKIIHLLWFIYNKCWNKNDINNQIINGLFDFFHWTIKIERYM